MQFNIKNIVCLSLLMSLASVSFPSVAQEQEWWFDIEVIVYKRNISPDDIAEQFDSGLNLIDARNTIDILNDFVHPDLTSIRASLPVCFAEPVNSDFPDFTYQYDESLYTDIEYQTLIVDPLLEEDFTAEINDDIRAQQVAVEVLAVESEELDEQDQPPPSLFSVPLIIPQWQPPKILENHACAYEPQENRQPFVDKIPKTIDGVEWHNYRQPYLLPQSSLEFTDLAKDIGRKQSLTTLLHMAWRQQVFFDQDDSQPLHLIAGKNYGREFDLDGKHLVNRKPIIVETPMAIIAQTPMATDDINELKITEIENTLFAAEGDFAQNEPVDLITKIQNLLGSNQTSMNWDELLYLAKLQPSSQSDSIDHAKFLGQVKPKFDLDDIWELDGKLKIFLRYIGRTPYLHIDGQLDFRAPVIESVIKTPTLVRDTKIIETPILMESESEMASEQFKKRLQSFEFKQIRRVISQQLHYFDHPLFGLLVQIRRYDLPPPVEEPEIVE